MEFVMELKNLVTGGVFECSDEMGNRLIAEGGYEAVGDEPKKAPAKRTSSRRTHKTESE
jgi:hypothetical protein